MGIILSRIYDKPSTRDTLERIEQEIQNIEERKWDKIKREQFIVQILSFLPLTILIANVCIFLYPSDSTWRDKLMLSIPIALLNLFLYACKRCIQWYSKWSLLNEEARLRKLQKEKKRILEMVCETESYRVAAELLEKYDPKQLRRRENKIQDDIQAASPKLNRSLTKITASPIRTPSSQQKQQQQHLPSQHQQMMHSSMIFHNQSFTGGIPSPPISQQFPSSVPAAPPPTPITKSTNSKAQLNTSISSSQVAASSVQGRPVRPILSKDRSFIEKVVDWVVADGPDNRFALICRFCYGHNGMSLAEEFETINFRCCYCYNLNTATNKIHQVHDQLQVEREKNETTATKSNSDSKGSEKDTTNDASGGTINQDNEKKNAKKVAVLEEIEPEEKLEKSIKDSESRKDSEVAKSDSNDPEDSSDNKDKDDE